MIPSGNSSPLFLLRPACSLSRSDRHKSPAEIAAGSW